MVDGLIGCFILRLKAFVGRLSKGLFVDLVVCFVWLLIDCLVEYSVGSLLVCLFARFVLCYVCLLVLCLGFVFACLIV